MPAVAARLERRTALAAFRRALPRGRFRVLTARSPAHLATLLSRHLIDSVVVGAEAVSRSATFEALRIEYPTLPVFLYAPIRSGDAALLGRVERRGVAGVLVEGLDDPVMAGVLRRAGLTARREQALLPMAAALDLVDPLQIAAWRVIVAEAPERLATEDLAIRLGVSRETLSRRFAAGRAPTLKVAIDIVRLVAAGQLLGSPEWRVTDAAQLLGYSSPSLLQRAARRLVGTSAGTLGTLPPDRILARLTSGGGSRWS
jgi:AraC-like DNA-binding protein